ncbi:MAG: type II secretion system protein GspD [Rhodocyclaceae bacterium]|nr:MAG: type II secretion system protein GspD [Rhodocyclaceae bacterium]
MTTTLRQTLLALLVALMAGAWAPLATAKAEEEVSLNFVNVDIDTVVRAISKISNRNFLIDPRVKGTLNIVTSKPVSAEMAYQILMSALRLQGFAAVDEGGVIKVVPEADAKTHSLPVVKSRGEVRGDRPVTRVFHIQNESATQLLQVVKPLVSANNTVAAYGNNNTLIVTDYAENVDRIARILDALDVPQGDVAVIPVRYAAAQDLAVTVGKLMSDSGAATAPDASQRVTVVADSRLNALLVKSDSPARITAVRQLVANLDQQGVAGNIHVVYLKNADAVKVAQTLRSVLSGDARTAGQAAANGGQAQSANASQGGLMAGAPGGEMIQADRATNSLIITAPEAIYSNLRNVVDMLDRRRAQVFVEALIAEVTSDRAAEFGIQFQSGSTGSKGATLFGGTNFASGGSNILGLAANPATAAKGLNLAVAKGTLTLPDGTQVLNLSMLARFLESQTNTNILSTPNIVMLDNEEAKIVVGQNLPFVTGQYTNTGGGTTPANPFQTIERKDVGLTLRIRPQISEGGALTLQIFQESSSVVASTVTSASGPVTNKRSIETTAVVDDGEIIALGGLVQDSYTSGADKVPLLGDIPVVGNLFRYDNRQRSKTNLFVFLRPRILRDSESYQSLTSDRYEYVIGQQKAVSSPADAMSKEGPAPELPAVSGKGVKR